MFFDLPCRSLQILTAYQSEWIRMVIAFQSIDRHTAIGFTPSTPRSGAPKFPPAIRSKYEASGRLGVLGTGCNGSSHPLQFVVQKYLSNTQIHPVCWLHTILHDCIILYEYPSNAATFFRLQLWNLVGSHGWASPSATFGQLDRVSCGATRAS